jgi:homoserine O-acetyltransferase/O-succinyltransferase
MVSLSGMLQRMLLEMVRNDRDYNNGNYVTQPRLMKIATVFMALRLRVGR